MDDRAFALGRPPSARKMDETAKQHQTPTPENKREERLRLGRWTLERTDGRPRCCARKTVPLGLGRWRKRLNKFKHH